jgi:hypothetical protein
MADAAKQRHNSVAAAAIPLNKYYGNLCNKVSMETIRNKIAPPPGILDIDDIPQRHFNLSIKTAISDAIRAEAVGELTTSTVDVVGNDGVTRKEKRATFPIPVVIQLNSPLEFSIGERVIVSTHGVASPTNPNMFTQTVFEVYSSDSDSDSDSDSGLVTIGILRSDRDYTLQELQNEYSTITDVVWNGERYGNPDNPFTFTIHKTRCALVTRYISHLNQLVVVFGPTPAGAGSAGGSRRKRVISRKLKSLNKKRKYTQRLTRRRRYSYKRGRKN